MKKSVKKGICLAGIMALSIFGGAMTSYAIGPEETAQAVAKPVTYNQQSVRALGNWEQQSNGTWRFKCLDGSYLTNSWVESLTEAGAYYFVDSNGNMMTNSKTPDGYTVDGAGLWRSGVEVSGSSSGSEVKSSSDNSHGYDDELWQKYLEDVKEHADTLIPAYGGLH